EFGGFGDAGADGGADLLEIVLARLAGTHHAGADLLDRIMLLPHFLHFLLAPIFRRIGHGVAAVTIRLHLQNIRALALAAPFERPLAGGDDGAHIHAVDL